MLDLFEDDNSQFGKVEHFCTDVVVMRGYATSIAPKLIELINEKIVTQSPYRQMSTKRGYLMSSRLTNTGHVGWQGDNQGYRYTHRDPLTNQPWPQMPCILSQLAIDAANKANYPNFSPDSCVINHYRVGAKMGLHQDKDEQDFTQPIVSVSLGIPAVFQMGGFTRTDSVINIPLMHGDVVVWGGEDRLRFHGVLPIKQAMHSLVGANRINLTFRKAL
jgi:alkylated DNA repair protein (DNA oxidative demethylase)